MAHVVRVLVPVVSAAAPHALSVVLTERHLNHELISLVLLQALECVLRLFGDLFSQSGITTARQAFLDGLLNERLRLGTAELALEGWAYFVLGLVIGCHLLKFNFNSFHSKLPRL